MHQIPLRLRLRLNPTGVEAEYSAPPDLHSWILGVLLLRGGRGKASGRGRGRRGAEECKREREKKGRGRERWQGECPLDLLPWKIFPLRHCVDTAASDLR